MTPAELLDGDTGELSPTLGLGLPLGGDTFSLGGTGSLILGRPMSAAASRRQTAAAAPVAGGSDSGGGVGGGPRKPPRSTPSK